MGVELEALTVRLIANIEQYTAPLAQATTQAVTSSREIQASFVDVKQVTEAAGESFGELRGTILGLVGIGGFGELIKTTMETVEQLHHLSEETGISTTTIQELQFAALEAGVPVDTFNNALTIFTRKLGEASEGNAAASDAFRLLGVNILDSSGKIKDHKVILDEVANSVSKFGDESERTAALFPIFGRQAVQLGPMMKDGAEGFDAAAKKAHDMGAVLDKETIESIRQSTVEIKELAKSIATTLGGAVSGILPVITFFAKGIKGWVDNLKEAGDAIGGIIAKIGGFDEKNTTAINTAKKMTDQQKEATQAVEAHTNKINENTVAQNKRIQTEATAIISANKDSKTALATIDEEIKVIQQASARELKDKTELNKALANLRNKRDQEVKKENAKNLQEDLKDIQEDQKTKFYYNNQIFQDKIALLQDELQAENLAADEKAKIQRELNAILRKEDKDMAKDRMDTINELAQLQHSKSQSMAAIGKAAAMVQIGISTEEGATKAYAALAGIPVVGPALGAAAAAAVIAYGAERLASTAGIDVGFAQGADMIPGGATSPSAITVHGGERVVPNETNQILQQFLMDYKKNGGGGLPLKIQIQISKDAIGFIEAKLIERGRIRTGQTSVFG